MNVYFKDLANIKDEKVYEFEFELYEISNNIFLKGLKDIDGYFIFYYDIEDHLEVEYKIIGKMICPDAYTLEDVLVPFSIEETERVTNNMDEEGIYLDTYNKIEDIVKQIVLPIVPIKVVKSEKIEYSNGDGWSVLKEEELTKSDPRLKEIKKV